MEQNQELMHHGVKGQKWGVINKKDSEDVRLASEKARLNYDANIYRHKRENDTAEKDIKMANDTERLKAKLEYKRDIKLAQIQKTIADGQEETDRICSYNQTRALKYKYDAQTVTAVAGALAISSVGKNASKAYSLGEKYKSKAAQAVGAANRGANILGDINIKNDSSNRSVNLGQGAVYDTRKLNYNSNNHTNSNNNSHNVTDSILDSVKSKIKKKVHSASVDECTLAGDVLIDTLFEDENSLEHAGKGHLQGGKSGRRPWGMGLYVNPDGSLTDAGRQRYYGGLKESREVRDNIDKSVQYGTREIDELIKQGKLKPENRDAAIQNLKEKVTSTAYKEWESNAQEKLRKDEEAYAKQKVEAGKSVLEGSSKLTGQVKDLIPNVPGQRVHPDYSDLSTQELRARTDRLNAERDYANASGQMQYIKSKEEMQREKWQTAGIILNMMATVGGIVLPIIQTKHFNGAGKGNN